MTLTFQQARETVLREVSARRSTPPAERLHPLEADGRILSEPITADRDYPPFPRSARDGFAVRAADLPGELQVIGEVRAGENYQGPPVGPGQAVEIMTGAALPEGADAVLMVEHVERLDDNRIRTERKHSPGDNFNPRGIEAATGSVQLEPGKRLGHADIALLAMTGGESVAVYARPRIAILPTGDEIVDVGQTPEPYQIRNSNAWSMAVQAARAGGAPTILPIARDNWDSTHAQVARGLADFDLLLLSGGVSAGKYDIVERVLADFGAKFFFDRVKIQPGQPLVFGDANKPGPRRETNVARETNAGGKPGSDNARTFFFGLPGNPASTMVTLELFARAAIELLGGASHAPLPFLEARLSTDFRQKPGLTRFLPAILADDGSSVAPASWKGSGDIGAQARANAYLVTDPDRESWAAGDRIQVLLK